MLGSFLHWAQCHWTRLLALLAFAAPALGQPTATLIGRVLDASDAGVPAAQISLTNEATNTIQTARADDVGIYQAAALPPGAYRISVRAPGFRTCIVTDLTLEVGQTLLQDFRLIVGESSEQVIVTSTPVVIERATTSVGATVGHRTVQEIPLNGRFLLDLGLLTPGSVTPPQNAFSAAPVRGGGSFAINTGGNREEAVNFLINGITLNNLWFSSISFQPPISSIQEFKLDNSTLQAEYGQNSGAVVNIATRSGANKFHAELFEYLRNDALDARNFFTLTSNHPPPFQRNQFGGSLGGAIYRNRTFFFLSYEGLRQRQGLDLNSLVFSDGERSSVANREIAKLVELVPRANFIDSGGASRFIGSATAPVNVDNQTIDLSHNFTEQDRLHGFYGLQRRNFIEPSRQGNTVPGFGNRHHSLRQILTLNETHSFGSALVNTARFGFNRIFGMDYPTAQLNPADLGIQNGISQPIGLPQMNIAGGSLNFGGPGIFPSGRGDTMLVVADTANFVFGRHSLKLGGELRQFLNNNIRVGTGTFNFPTIADFLAGSANSFNVTLGDQSSSIAQAAVGFFAQNNYKWRPGLTLELGLRYEWNVTPTERYNRFIVFDPKSASLLRVGTHIREIYKQNNRNLQPRLGFAWSPGGRGNTVVRGAYGILVDQPVTSVASGRSANPPLAIPLTFTGTIRLDNAINVARAAGLAPQTVDHGFDNAYIQSWNLNLQREFASDLGVMAGYFGSKGTHLILRRNINQPWNGVRPFAALSEASPFLPGTPIGNVIQVESTGNSNYHALWVSANKRLLHGLQFNASYSWSKSLDYNSFSLRDVMVQNSYHLRGDRGISDFDARHRVVVSGIYELPFRRNRFMKGWQVATIVQLQSGNPINLVTSNSTVNGVANTLRPDVAGPIKVLGRVDQWFDGSVLTPVARFGSLGRNVVIGPGFHNMDLSAIKNAKFGERMRAQLRVELFDLLNHANFGQPGNVLGTPGFGRITNTRFPTGESGSSRQVQFAVKLML